MTVKRTKKDMENRRLAQARWRERMKEKGMVEIRFQLPPEMAERVVLFVERMVQDGLKETIEVEKQ